MQLGMDCGGPAETGYARQDRIQREHRQAFMSYLDDIYIDARNGDLDHADLDARMADARLLLEDVLEGRVG